MTIQSQLRIAAVLATATQWTAARRKSDGKAFFFVPGSTAGSVYMTAADGCTCPAAPRFVGPCKHSRAVAQYLAAKAQPAPQPMRRPAVSLAPVCSEAGCDDDAGRTGQCWQHAQQVAA